MIVKTAKMPSDLGQHPSSFRDPSGFIFTDEDGCLLRQVNRSYEADYDKLMSSGLYENLVGDHLMVPHKEVSLDRAVSSEAIAVIEPEKLDFISYPYEWSFSQLKRAARLTLEIQKRALAHGMTLKDATSYNVQFVGARPVFIDTLSFAAYEEGTPWSAYGQFCRHFLAPLALMAKTDIDLSKLLTVNLDGIPLDLAAKLLPWRSKFNASLAMHIHLHSRLIRQHADSSDRADAGPAEKNPRMGGMSASGIDSILQSLVNTIKKLTWKPAGTEWADYYTDNSYSEDGFEQKRDLVRKYLSHTNPATVWDLGGNTGAFSRLASERGIPTVSFDIDPACVERNYRQCREEKNQHLLPLRMDLCNPSPAIGWANAERETLADRGPCDTAMALALIHHIAISNNTPLEQVSRYFAGLCKNLIIEFVPKEDPQVRRLLATREDIFPSYDKPGFEAAFSNDFDIIEQNAVGDDGRVLYLLQNRCFNS